MILEGIVTTIDREGALNIAPMGPTIGPDLSFARFELRPFRTSHTYANLKATGNGVFHIIDDVRLLAQAAIGVPLIPSPPLRRAQRIDGWILEDACRYYEFKVLELNDGEERARILVETLSEGRFRDSLGFNRARHAVLEAAIKATRVAFLPRAELLTDFDELATIVAKTGGPTEEQAMEILRDHVLNSPPPGAEHHPQTES